MYQLSAMAQWASIPLFVECEGYLVLTVHQSVLASMQFALAVVSQDLIISTQVVMHGTGVVLGGVQGSLYGDSQLVRLHPEAVDPAQPTNFVEVMDVWTNLGPIIDLAVVDLERQGQGQVVTCSGKGPDSSLRIVRNGIGMIEQAAVELAGQPSATAASIILSWLCSCLCQLRMCALLSTCHVHPYDHSLVCLLMSG